MRWDRADGQNDPQSGSLVVTTSTQNMSLLGAFQCIPAVGERTYALLTQVFIRSGQGASRAAGLSVQYFASADCSSSAGPIRGQHDYLEVQADQWVTLEHYVATPAGIRSMLVRLALENIGGGTPFEAKFDNVLVKQR